MKTIDKRTKPPTVSFQSLPIGTPFLLLDHGPFPSSILLDSSVCIKMDYSRPANEWFNAYRFYDNALFLVLENNPVLPLNAYLQIKGYPSP